MDDLDTGLGWDDLGTMGTYTGTPSTSFTADRSRQQLSDPTKPFPQQVIEEEREDSPFETNGGLKNMNIQSPTSKVVDNGETRSPAHGGYQKQDRRSPGNETPDNWKSTPRNGNKTPETSRTMGRKSAQSNKSGAKTPGNQTPGNQTPREQSPGKQTPRNRTPGNRSPGVRGPGAPSPGNESPGNLSQDNQSLGNRSQTGRQSQRMQDSGLDDV